MFPHPVVAFLAYLEAPNSILAKNLEIRSFLYNFPLSRIFPCFPYSPFRHLRVTLWCQCLVENEQASAEIYYFRYVLYIFLAQGRRQA